MLRNVGRDFVVRRRVDGKRVDEDWVWGWGGFCGEDVEKSWFFGIVRVNDGEDLGRMRGEGDVVENVRRWFCCWEEWWKRFGVGDGRGG